MSKAMDKPTANDGHGNALCGAQRRQSDGTCRKPAGWGTPTPGIGRCRLHGGNTPTHRTGAANVATEAEARAMLGRLGEPDPLGDPLEELLNHAAKVRAFEDVIRERLSELREFSSDDVALVDREKAMVRMYGEAMDRSHRVLVDLNRLGLDERLTQVREIQAERVVAALRRVIAHPDLALDADHQRRARALLASELLSGRVTESPMSIVNVQVTEPEKAVVSQTSAARSVPEAGK